VVLSPDGRWIAVETGSCDDYVAVVRDDGSGRRVLGPGTISGTASPWSPDGKEVAWGGCDGVCVIDLASSRLRRIGLGEADRNGLAWTPDGKELAAIDGAGRLVLVELQSGGVSRVLDGKGSSPAGPDGRQCFRVGRRLEVVSAAGPRG
jgi:hypothetical protein